ERATDFILSGAPDQICQRLLLKHKANRRLVGPRLYEVRAAEGGLEVVKRVLVRVVGDGKLEGRPEPFALEKVVSSYRDVKYVTRSYSRRIVIVVRGARSRNHQPGGAVVLRCT